jgi:hypothetical protein
LITENVALDAITPTPRPDALVDRFDLALQERVMGPCGSPS